MQSHLSQFEEVWLADFEFQAPPGGKQVPICLVAREFFSGMVIRIWEDELHRLADAPFRTDPRSLFVAYFVSAELRCFLALGWKVPTRILDLYAEFRAATNGRRVLPAGRGLLGALVYHGLDSIEANEKDAMRALALRGGPWTECERTALLEYCESDVWSLDRLLQAMGAEIDLPRALYRGRYMAAVARMESNGIPIDVEALATLQADWEKIQVELISEVDKKYGVYRGTSFSHARFKAWLERQGIPWPRTDSGRLSVSDEAFRSMARAYPEIAALRELRTTLGQLRLMDLAIGVDGRNRALLSPFNTRTGRNSPSTTKFIFGPAVWLRSLIRPEPGFGLAYVDWSQQEFAIAAALSGDENMREAYRSGDPYLSFGKQARTIPLDATKESHKEERNLCKACVLGVQYGMGSRTLAASLGRGANGVGVSRLQAHQLLSLHRTTYKRFWEWVEGRRDAAMLHGRLDTCFGWPLFVGSDANPRALINHPMQSHGAEMMRVAAILATERGIRICAPVHDAFLIEAPLAQFEGVTASMSQVMREAGNIVLDGFDVRCDVEPVRHPERYRDPRGEEMWQAIWRIVSRLHRSTDRT